MDIEAPNQEIVVAGTFPPAPLVLVDNAFVQHLGDTEGITKVTLRYLNRILA